MFVSVGRVRAMLTTIYSKRAESVRHSGAGVVRAKTRVTTLYPIKFCAALKKFDARYLFVRARGDGSLWPSVKICQNEIFLYFL